MKQGWALTLWGLALVSLESLGMFFCCLEWENVGHLTTPPPCLIKDSETAAW